jgi:hypothetical protein
VGCRAAAVKAIIDSIVENEDGQLLEYLPKQDEQFFISFGPSPTFTIHKVYSVTS